MSIAEAIRLGGAVTVEGVATTDLTLIDASGRLLVIQDSTAAIEVRLPVGGAAAVVNLAGRPLGPGAHLQVTGVIGRSYGAPRLSATAVAWLGSVAQPRPLRITGAPGPGLEWRLVLVTGRLDAVHRLGQRWRADLIVGAVRIPVMGLTGAHLAVGRLLPGRRVTIIGIVRRAYPSAIDQRFAIDPRFVSDMHFEPAGPIHPTSTDHQGGSSGATGGGDTGETSNPGAGPVSSALPIVDLAELAARRGQPVRVGGLVTRVDGAFVSLDDGTATGRLRLTGGAAAYLDLVQVGDPLEATGVVQVDGSGLYVLVTDPDGVARAGDPGSSVPAASAGADLAGPSAGPADPGGIAANGLAGAQLVAGEATDRTAINLAEALALTLFGAMAALLLALAISLFVARRGGQTSRPEGSADEPCAGPTLGPS